MPRDKEGEVREMREKLAQISKQVQEISAKLPRGEATPGRREGASRAGVQLTREGQPPLSAEERERLQKRLTELRAQAAKAREAGSPVKPEDIRREYQAIMQKLGPSPEGRPGMLPGQPMSPEEMQRRAMHIQAAADNLRAAGMNELADHLQREVDMMRRGGGPDGSPDGSVERRGRRVGVQVQVRGSGMAVRDPEGPIADLSREVRELKRQVESLQELVKKREAQSRSPRDPAGSSREPASQPNKRGAESRPPLDPEGASRQPIPPLRNRGGGNLPPLDPEGASRRFY